MLVAGCESSQKEALKCNNLPAFCYPQVEGWEKCKAPSHGDTQNPLRNFIQKSCKALAPSMRHRNFRNLKVIFQSFSRGLPHLEFDSPSKGSFNIFISFLGLLEMKIFLFFTSLQQRFHRREIFPHDKTHFNSLYVAFLVSYLCMYDSTR